MWALSDSCFFLLLMRCSYGICYGFPRSSSVSENTALFQFCGTYIQVGRDMSVAHRLLNMNHPPYCLPADQEKKVYNYG